ncbi:MAG: hypothetical protein Q4C75_02235 [Bergeyella zoohelcum]|nr:hypothetical protein [Bergeyella zoohelcum]
MKALHLIKKLIVDSQILVALCGTAFAVFFMMEQKEWDLLNLFLIFILYWNGYLYTKFQRSLYKTPIIFINILSLLILLYNFHKINYKWLIILALGISYNSSFLYKGTRNFPLVKNFHIALVWSLINAWLFQNTLNWSAFICSFLFIFTLILPFDIRDMKQDKILTFPKLIGIKATKTLCYILIISANLLSFFHFEKPHSLAFALASIMSVFIIFKTENHRSDAYFYVLV